MKYFFYGKERGPPLIKLYTQEVTSCLNCPNVSANHNAIGKGGIRFSEYRCRVTETRNHNYQLIHNETDRYYFPEWCPLIDTDEYSNCN